MIGHYTPINPQHLQILHGNAYSRVGCPHISQVITAGRRPSGAGRLVSGFQPLTLIGKLASPFAINYGLTLPYFALRARAGEIICAERRLSILNGPRSPSGKASALPCVIGELEGARPPRIKAREVAPLGHSAQDGDHKLGPEGPI